MSEAVEAKTIEEQQAAHAASPLTVPAPSIGSRLPAGSTLEVVPGLHVAHPHAEVNLPGKGDPRLGETTALTEFTTIEKGTVITATKPLADEVKPRTLVVTKDPDHETGTPATVELKKQ